MNYSESMKNKMGQMYMTNCEMQKARAATQVARIWFLLHVVIFLVGKHFLSKESAYQFVLTRSQLKI